ncbi:Mce-associated membrane protein [Rhodococcus sp. OAS809]|uniref:hypothetical protein n=1 Tax=Rhodococcus sp. OAS809 TaxID=2663874 RepID=UPI00339698F9
MLWQFNPTGARETQRQGFVDGAVAGALALIDVYSATLDENLATLQALSTGAFADELKSGESAFVASIRDFAVDSDGRVDTAALASESGTSGVVLIAASAQVANSAGESSARTYRLRVGVEEVEGRVLMSSVEFVP